MNLYVWLLTIFAAFGGFMFGYDTGVINGVKDTAGFRETFNVSQRSSGNGTCTEDVKESTLLGLIVSTFSLGCLVGALAAGGGAVQTASVYVWMMFVGRIVAGIGVGILSMVVPIYNAELAPSGHRGRLVSLNQLAITAGIMVSFLADLLAAKFEEGWRVALGVQCVFGIVLTVGMLFLPETPRWLSKKRKNERALNTLAKIRRATTNDVLSELAEIKASLKDSSTTNASQTFKLLLNWNTIQRLLIGVFLQLFQQFTGMNVIMYYSTSIFCKIGVASYISTSVVGALNFFTTILSIVLVDKVGRKALLLVGGAGMLVSMAGAATVLLVFRVEEEEEGGRRAEGMSRGRRAKRQTKTRARARRLKRANLPHPHHPQTRRSVRLSCDCSSLS
jgi:MFS family permease